MLDEYRALDTDRRRPDRAAGRDPARADAADASSPADRHASPDGGAGSARGCGRGRAIPPYQEMTRTPSPFGGGVLVIHSVRSADRIGWIPVGPSSAARWVAAHRYPDRR